MAHALGISRLDLYLQFERALAEGELDRIRELVRARGADTPVAYLLGAWEFFSLTFAVDERVLVPRPETELLVERALAHLKTQPEPSFADVGTGSGCIAVAVLHAVEAARGYGTDTSGDALVVAAANAERHGVGERLTLGAGAGLRPLPAGTVLDAVVSNPPYIVRGDASVQAGVDAHEPHAALYVSGDDALEVFRAVAEEARAHLRAGGLLAMEVGAGYAEPGAALMRDLGYDDVETSADLASIPRVVCGTMA